MRPGDTVLALEKHPGRAERLRTRFAEDAVVVVQADLRDLRLPGRPFRVVANPPFHLARPAPSVDAAVLRIRRC